MATGSTPAKNTSAQTASATLSEKPSPQDIRSCYCGLPQQPVIRELEFAVSLASQPLLLLPMGGLDRLPHPHSPPRADRNRLRQDNVLVGERAPAPGDRYVRRARAELGTALRFIHVVLGVVVRCVPHAGKMTAARNRSGPSCS